MPLHPHVVKRFDELKAIRTHLHTCPEIGTETAGTVAFITSKLDEYGLSYEAIGENSVLAKVDGKAPGKTVAFRGDMDGLVTQEETGLPYASQTDGRMHACGHDGHTTTMLALAQYLSTYRDFDGTILLLFQSGEEGYGGAKKVIEDGLFEKYPIDLMFGYHNWPGEDPDKIIVHQGPCMASEDRFDIKVTGRSGHASMPHGCIEPFAAVADMIKAAQTIIPRKVSAHDKAVISITQVHGGSAYNIIPDDVMIRGNVRTVDGGVQDCIESSLATVVDGVAKTYGVEAEFTYYRKHPVLMNSTPELAIAAAERVVGKENVLTNVLPAMGSEDYAFFMEHTKGCFVWVGNGENSPLLHNSKYDFNDEAMLTAASLFIELIHDVM
ncbi:amidohydrolase [Desulfobaculum bizertense]|uniref:amidohydrolase n=1 Tax=Desulfobaculum bizertense TaxID=376490 RepID=UPI001F3E0926|nr:amidohydrolase [Desulfobaculum bizertense]UIJ38247.1 amidohydrolase [Desulfobaculum bizertense]